MGKRVWLTKVPNSHSALNTSWDVLAQVTLCHCDSCHHAPLYLSDEHLDILSNHVHTGEEKPQ